jgi:UDP-N-acetylmuramate--alanine ligase
MFRKARRLHFVGVGGSGMSGIAEVLVNMGYPVSGSDLATNPATERLSGLGARIRRGHSPDQVRDADAVVISSAVGEDNPEVVEARRLRIPVIPRAEMLAELMRLKYGVAVAGAHGKTTTTALIAEVLTRGGLDPTVVIGGRVGSLKSGAKLGNGEIMVAEADESDGSFLKMKPTIAVVTNIDREHLDYYRDLDQIRDAFTQFLSRVPFYGEAVVCLDEPNVREILDRIDRKVLTYGLCEDADLRATEIEVKRLESSFVVHYRGERLGTVRLHSPGRHQVYNSLAALGVGLELDVPFVTIAAALGEFPGVDRRMQRRGEVAGAVVLDDYAHHPTEIAATLSAVREGFDARTVVVFQPHRYSRTQALLEEFGAAFSDANHVILTGIYAAGERPIEGIDGSTVARALTRHGHPSVTYEPSLDAIPDLLRRTIREGDVVLTLGAGDVWKVGEELLRSASAGGDEAQPRRSACTPK